MRGCHACACSVGFISPLLTRSNATHLHTEIQRRPAPPLLPLAFCRLALVKLQLAAGRRILATVAPRVAAAAGALLVLSLTVPVGAMAASSLSGPPHVVIIGGGLAGLAGEPSMCCGSIDGARIDPPRSSIPLAWTRITASLEAADRGARVTLLDKCPSLGGNSAKVIM